MTAVPLVVKLIVSVVFGIVTVPFPVNVALICVWFIGTVLVVVVCSCMIGSGDNCIPDDVLVVVVAVVLPGVEAAVVLFPS